MEDRVFFFFFESFKYVKYEVNETFWFFVRKNVKRNFYRFVVNKK